LIYENQQEIHTNIKADIWSNFYLNEVSTKPETDENLPAVRQLRDRI
jgi:hypothetical protein